MSEILNVNGAEYVPAIVAGKRFGYTRDYILMLARDGKIKAEKIGHKWYVDPKSIEIFFTEAERVREVRRKAISEERKRELRIHAARNSIRSHSKKAKSPLLITEAAAVLLLAVILGTTGYVGISVNQQEAQVISSETSFFERLARSLYDFISPSDEITITARTKTTAQDTGDLENGVHNTALESIRVTGATTTYTSLVVAPDTVLTTTTAESIRAAFSDDVSVSIDPMRPDTGLIVPQFRDREGEAYRFIMVPVNQGGG